MSNGRPADNTFATYFAKDGLNLNVDSLDKATDVSGRQFFTGKLQDGLKNGPGREWLYNCRMFIGDWKFNNMNEGELYEMQQDGTYNLSSVKYDYIKDKKVVPDKQVPILKEMIA